MDQLEKHNFQGRNRMQYESNWKNTLVVMVAWLSIVLTTIALSYIIK